MARVNGFRCDGCGVFDKGKSGDQREPGPFLPAGWWGASYGEGPCFCPVCTKQIKSGVLTQ